MNNNVILQKVEKWFEYYKYVYAIFLKNIILNKNGDFSMLLSFFNTVPSEYDDYGIGQIVKLELLNNKEVIESISLKTTNEEEQIFQYVWTLVVNHFINENYDKNNKIMIYSINKSTKGFKYLLSDLKINNQSIVKADFSITYNKNEYDEFLKQLVFNHNNGYDNEQLVSEIKKYLLEGDLNNSSSEFNNSLKKSEKVYQHLKYKQKLL